MKTWTIGWSTAVLTVVACVLTACQGKDPGANYSSLKADAQPYDSSLSRQNASPTAGIPDRLACPPPEVIVVNDAGEKLMKFPEGKETSYDIIVRNTQGGNFTLELSELKPSLSSDVGAKRASLTLKEARDQNGFQAKYKFTWKPGKLSNGQTEESQTMGLKFSSESKSKCQPVTVKVNLNVVPAKGGG